MPVQVLVVAAIVVVAGYAAVRWAGAWWKFRGSRVITCPENHRPAGVRVDASHAALTGLASTPNLRLSQCSRWPERAGCGQDCLSQIASAPEDCLVRNILLKWYAGKTCAACGRPFGEIPLAGSHPAVLLADKKSVDWNGIRADQLHETLMGATPICFACHMANTFVREHPELVVDRRRGEGQ